MRRIRKPTPLGTVRRRTFFAWKAVWIGNEMRQFECVTVLEKLTQDWFEGDITWVPFAFADSVGAEHDSLHVE